MMMAKLARVMFALALVPACAGSPAGDSDTEDGEHDNLGGKSDSFVEGSNEARAILALVNDAATDVTRLDVEVGLSTRAAENIIAGRGTGYATLAALDAVSYVGPATLTALYEFAKSAGYGAGDSDADLSIQWSIKNMAGVSSACPAGYDTIALHSQMLTAAGQPTGLPTVDLYDCADGAGTASLTSGTYRVWIDVASHDGLMTYASSTSTVVTLDATDQTATFSILSDGGYFQVAWKLAGETSGQSLRCADVAGEDGIALDATVSGSTQLFTDLWNCEDGSGVTSGLAAGTYTLSTSLINQSSAALGIGDTLADRTIEPRNKVTDLGTVTIPVTGR